MHHNEVYPIGRIGKPHGVKGEVNFFFHDDVFDQVDADYLIIETDGILVPFFIEEYRFRSDDLLLLKLDGIDTQEQARELTNCTVYFERAKTPQPDTTDSSPQIPTHSLIGFSIIDADTQRPVGTVKGIDDSTINTLFEVETPSGDTALIPANEQLISDINPSQLTIVMQIPQGLLAL